jgi:ketosteroid isomerase-like protein
MITQQIVAVLALVLSTPIAVHAEHEDVRNMMSGFLAAFSNREVSAFMPYFSEDATVFFPPSAAAPTGRIQGRVSIEQSFKAVFDRYPPRSTTPRPSISPRDLLIQQFEGSAVVSFHLGDDIARQRRTFVLRRIGEDWKIVHLHGSAAGERP